MIQSHKGMAEAGRLAIPAALLAALMALTSCSYDHYDNAAPGNATVGVELSIMTRAIISNSQTYEVGTQWENYIDIIGGDYKIYFFTNDKTDATATDDSGRNTLIAEFVPKEVSAIDETDYTQYTLSGEVGDDIAAYSDFKVVVLANWGAYPEVTAGTTTIDALVESENATFSAETFLSGVDETHLIPFYGVREYSNVEWREGWRTTLPGGIPLLRALAKVESWGFSMEVKQYAAPTGADYVNVYFTDYYYEQDDDAMTIEFPISDIVAVFVMIPTLLYNGRDITAEAEWTCVCTSSEQTSVIVTKSPTVSDGLVEVHVTDLTATTGYTYKLTLTATWTGDGGGEMGITYDITTTMGSYRPHYNQDDIYVYPGETTEPDSVKPNSAAPARGVDRPKSLLVSGGRAHMSVETPAPAAD